ncbi:hypothetical protein ACEQ8H_008232 [Pleosporales sp. CAS-2024a]
MKYAFAQVAFGLGANALVARNAGPWCVQLQALGGVSGTVGERMDGQIRVGGSNPAGCYCFSNGGFTDTNGFGCVVTGPTNQVHCDRGSGPTKGFGFNSNGDVTYNGGGKFYACPSNDHGEYNIYTSPVSGQAKCAEVRLCNTGSCSPKGTPPPPPGGKGPPPPPPGGKGPPPPPPNGKGPPPPPPDGKGPPPPPPGGKPPPPPGSCPADLNGNYQYPHLMVPVNSGSPNTAYGTSYHGKVGPSTCTIFNFDIPSSYSGQKCSVLFLFPKKENLKTSSYTLSGSGMCSFTQLSMPAGQWTTFANQPSKMRDLGSVAIAPGNSYTIASGPCAAGHTVSYELCSNGDLSLDYFQDYNPSPIGMYVRAC